MFIIAKVYPEYNVNHHDQYNPAPRPYTIMYLDGHFSVNNDTDVDPGYTEEDFDRIVMEDNPGECDIEYYLVSKIVKKAGAASRRQLEEDESL